MGRAQIIILHGHQLATSHHYALALIVQRCNELRHHCDTLTTALRAKRASLTRIRDLLLRLEEVLNANARTLEYCICTLCKAHTDFAYLCMGRLCVGVMRGPI